MRRFAMAAVACVALAGCIPGRAGRVTPERSNAVAESRVAIALAAGDRNLEALFAHLAPGAVLVHGADSLDLRTAITRYAASLPAGSAPELWFAPRHLRRCVDWAYETGGRAGLNSYVPGSPAVSHRYKYAIAWTTDSATGRAQVEQVALIRTRDEGTPRVAGCRPTAHEQFGAQRAGIAVTPGAGFVHNRARGDVEGGLRSRNLVVGGAGIDAGFSDAGLFAPPLLTAWYRAGNRLRLEAFATIGAQRSAASSADTLNLSLAGFEFEQQWAALTPSIRIGEIRLGAGPAWIREAWRVSVEAIEPGPQPGTWALSFHAADAGSTRDRIGVLAHVSMAVPLTGTWYIDVRAFGLSVGGTRTPAAFNVSPINASSSSIGLGILFGAAF